MQNAGAGAASGIAELAHHANEVVEVLQLQQARARDRQTPLAHESVSLAPHTWVGCAGGALLTYTS